jgi:hypothetical protein
VACSNSKPQRHGLLHNGHFTPARQSPASHHTDALKRVVMIGQAGSDTKRRGVFDMEVRDH